MLWAVIAFPFLLSFFVDPKRPILRWVALIAIMVMSIVVTLKGVGYKGIPTIALWVAVAVVVYASIWLQPARLIADGTLLLLWIAFGALALWHRAKL